MERDPRISDLIKESGMAKPPDNFTGSVMERISSEPARTVYKPLIGKGGRILIILGVLGIILISILYSGAGDTLPDIRERITLPGWNLPEVSFSLDFLSGLSISSGIVAALVAIFILVLSDAGLNRRKLV
jgi:hypothetical protein